MNKMEELHNLLKELHSEGRVTVGIGSNNLSGCTSKHIIIDSDNDFQQITLTGKIDGGELLGEVDVDFYFNF